MLTNQSAVTAAFVGYNAAFNIGFRSGMPEWNKVATRVPSSGSSNDYSWIGQFPRLQEWLGKRAMKSIAGFNYAIVNKDFAVGVPISRNVFEDGQAAIQTPLFQEMGYSAAMHPDELVFELLASGDAELCYDGQNFFDTDHDVNGTAVSNWGGGSGELWCLLDTSRMLKPLIFQERRGYNFTRLTGNDDEQVFTSNEYRFGVDARVNVGFGFWQMAYGSKQTLDATNFNAAFAAMENIESDEGRPLGIKPTVLVTTPSNRAAAEAILKAANTAAGATNTNYNKCELIISPWLKAA